MTKICRGVDSAPSCKPVPSQRKSAVVVDVSSKTAAASALENRYSGRTSRQQQRTWAAQNAREQYVMNHIGMPPGAKFGGLSARARYMNAYDGERPVL